MSTPDKPKFSKQQTPDVLPDIVRERYDQYLKDNRGDVSDTLHLCMVMVRFGWRMAWEMMLGYGDVLPMLKRIDNRTHHLIEDYEQFKERDDA